MIKKRIIIALKLMCMFVLPVLLWAFASNRHQSRKVERINIHYQEGENVYVTDDEILNMIVQGHEINRMDIDNATISQMEDRVDTHQMIKNAEVYLSVDGVLNVEVVQRKPIARICKGDTFYYMDDQGKQMPLSDHYSARVLLVSGEVNAENQSEIYKLIQQVYADDFLHKNVTAIQVLPRGIYSFYFRIPKFKVILGGSENFLSKINRLKAFYKKAEKDSLLNIYEVVDLRYDNQVVATRR